jgi:hypothetical protein
MTSEYEEIFSRVFGKINDPKLITLSNSDRNEIMTEWLHAVYSKPRIRRLFSSISCDDDMEELTYELNEPLDDYSDKEFVEELFVLGMVIEWLEPKVNSVVYTAPMIGGKEEKKLLDNYRYDIQRLDAMKTEQMKMIRDYGYMYNSYIGG